MKYIALFFPAVISMGIEYNKTASEKWNWFTYLHQYAFYLICNVFLSESLVFYIFKKDVTIDAFDSFSFFTKYLLVSALFAVVLPFARKIIKENISFSFETHKK